MHNDLLYEIVMLLLNLILKDDFHYLERPSNFTSKLIFLAGLAFAYALNFCFMYGIDFVLAAPLLK